MLEEQFFLRRKRNEEKLRQFGFVREGDIFRFTTGVMAGQFLLTVTVGENGVSTALTDSATGEDYALYRMAAPTGAFVGAVRETVEAVLTEIAARCFEPDIFHGEQTLALIQYVRETYGDELEFLWEKSPDNAIFRRKDNRKWYGAILTVPRSKLGLASAEIAEILDLRGAKEEIPALIDGEKYFPGWHMNKKNWFTLILDGSVPTEEVFRRVDESYQLAKK